MDTGLTSLGIVHTILSIVAIVAGAAALISTKLITLNNRFGQTYVIFTVFTCLTAFGIFRHGGFGPGHWLTIVTLLSLLVGFLAEKRTMFGRRSVAIGIFSFSLSFFLSMIFTVTETLTRLPPSQPIAASQESLVVLVARIIALVLFVGGVSLQIRHSRSART